MTDTWVAPKTQLVRTDPPVPLGKLNEPPRFGAVAPVTVNPSAFGAADWWSSGWWGLPSGGFAADIACEAGTVGDHAVAAVSLRGHRHRYDGDANQDAFALRWSIVDGRTALVAVVCDGMSSARHSAYGARRVADLLANELAGGLAHRLLFEDCPDHEVDRALARVVDEATSWSANEVGAPSADSSVTPASALETTMTFAAIEVAEGKRECSIGWVGDSPVFELGRTGWNRLGGRDSAASGLETSATAGVFSSPRPTVVNGRLDDESILLLCTDGIGNYIGDGEQDFAVGLTLAEAWRRPVDVLSFVNQASFDLPSADDDRTAVMIWPTAGQA